MLTDGKIKTTNGQAEIIDAQAAVSEQIKKQQQTETIAAIATAHGYGGVGVVRVSGAKATSISQKITHKDLSPRKAELVKFLDHQGEVIDVGLALFFPAPHSFTGEDVLELQGHGGPVVLNMLLEAVVAFGARVALPGEFSARAFENDKVDLAQAEAIADLISAQSRQAAGAAVRSLQGDFSKKINSIVDKLTALRTNVEAAIDFSEDAEYLGQATLPQDISEQISICEQVLKEAEYGRLLATGTRVVVLGEPNVGKSSLLNLMSGEDLAIVTDIPGTTRDVVRAQINLKGIRLEVLDTAGIRNETTDSIEQEGIKRAWGAVDTAQIVILMVDGAKLSLEQKTNSIASEALLQEVWNKWQAKIPETVKKLLVYNKVDQTKEQPCLGQISEFAWVKMSAKTGEGKHLLEEALFTLLGLTETTEETFTARKRHIDALLAAKEHLLNSQAWAEAGGQLELVAEELRLAQKEFSTITGAFTADDLLGKIFSEFCIGK